jgi:hypothetical protein
MPREKDFDYVGETKASAENTDLREVLYELFQSRPMPDDQLLICLGLYMRSSSLAKILFLNEAYQLVVNQPGIIVEFGTWWGQNIALFENLRAIYEPFNQTRRVVGFDTFSGYPKVSKNDRNSDTIKVGGYNVSDNYHDYLEKLIDYHEKNNVLGTIKKHELVRGDVTRTAPEWFSKHDETIVALAYFDMALYEPTTAALKAIRSSLIPGSVIMLDELNNRDYPGETRAFKEQFSDVKYSVRKSQFMTDRTFIILE